MAPKVHCVRSQWEGLGDTYVVVASREKRKRMPSADVYVFPIPRGAHTTTVLTPTLLGLGRIPHMNDITHHDVSSQMLTQFDREYFSRFSKLYTSRRVGITACSVESQLVFDSVLPLLFIFHFHFSIFL